MVTDITGSLVKTYTESFSDEQCLDIAYFQTSKLALRPNQD